MVVVALDNDDYDESPKQTFHGVLIRFNSQANNHTMQERPKIIESTDQLII